MITKLLFSNYYSFYEETEVSFEVGKKPSASSYDVITESGQRLNKVISVMGANGSGKTQLLKPFAFLAWFISESFLKSAPRDKILFEPHAMHRDEKTTFELCFVLGKIEYKYQLRLTKEHVIHESLHKKTSHLYSYIFIRDKVETGYDFKQKGFPFSSKLAKSLRGNCSLISAAHVHGVDVVTPIVEFFNNCTSNISVTGRANNNENTLFESAEYFNQNNYLNEKMATIICELDLGLSNVEVAEIEKTNKKGLKEKAYYPFGVHKASSGEFKLPFFEESNGTQSLYVLLSDILPVLETGGLLIIDEIDIDLHPHMLPIILDLFKFEHTNPKNAQIIFSSHRPEILNLLKKHQLYLVEKVDLESEAWRLDEVQGLRADDNIAAKYQAGALGGVPNI